MRAFHDSRDARYRAPFGAIAVDETVQLKLDVWDVPDARVRLRTWEDAVGETLYDMKAEGAGAPDDEGNASERFGVEFTPEQVGIVWYQFIVTAADGTERRYGALAGHMGGAGQLLEWEPPSFQLSVYDPAYEAPVWHAPINGYLHGLSEGGIPIDPVDVMATMLENYPAELCATLLPEGLKPCGVDGICLYDSYAEALEHASADSFACFALNDDVFGFWRRTPAGYPLCAIFNASVDNAHVLDVPLVDDEVSEVIGGYGVHLVDDEDGKKCVRIHLYQLGSTLLHFHPRERLQCVLEPGLGVLAHITSIPADGSEKAGTLGTPARAFVDWLAEAGVSYWQVLPVNPTDEFGSPYAGISAFAGSTWLLEGDVEAIATKKLTAAEAKKYRAFCKREAAWLEPYAAFMAVRRKVGEGMVWQDWPKKFRSYDADLVESDDDLRESAELFRREQFAFAQQWGELLEYAHGKGIALIGDMPLYVSSDSADVWAHPDLFQLDKKGRPYVVAGCPPDAFAADGQKWGNPLYNWKALEETGYDWWLRRLARAFELYDVVRLDHFIGFSRNFSIPEAESARAGVYHRGPGFEFFRLAAEQSGTLPLIAEDLGLLTPGVRSLVADCGFPGMDIVQFVDGNDPLGGYYPRPEKIAYTGTHDNQTLLGYVRQRYAGMNEVEVCDEIAKKVATCGASVCIVPLQDLMVLGDEARMNVPGVAEGNWVWQAVDDDMPDAQVYAARLVALHKGKS